jgi:uridine kinase
MDILEAFIKKYSQLIILILGLPCSNKSEIAKELEIDLGIPTLNINDYLIKDKFKELEFDDIKFKIYEDTDNYDWDKFNDDVEKLKSTGVIIYGNYIDLTKINYKYDFSFFYSMNMTLCKKILIENNLLNINEIQPNDKIYFEKIFNPKYEELKQNIKFNKFYNIKEDTKFNDSYDDIFDLLMNLIKSKLK